MEAPESEANRSEKTTSGDERQQSTKYTIPLSRKMQEVVERLRNKSDKAHQKSETVQMDLNISSLELSVEVIRNHPHMADGRLEKILQRIQTTSLNFPVEIWIEKIIDLYQIQKISNLDGHLCIAGILELDGDMSADLQHWDPKALTLLRQELEKIHGYPLGELIKNGTDPPNMQYQDEDPAVLHLDTAAEQDHLGRDGFVEALAIWLNRIWHKSNPADNRGKQNSFMVHLHGAWGSGKTTLLNILDSKLKETVSTAQDQWIVVNFNAWQHSHVQPVWWPLLNQIYKDARRQLKEQGYQKSARSIWRYDFRWKLFSGNKTVGLSVLILALILTIFVIFNLLSIGDGWTQLATYVTGAGTFITGGFYVFRSLFWGSAESADHYIQLTKDPLDRIKEYFRQLMERIDRPVMVFIDDLDRCEAPYVVKLLEQMQTLFNNSRVFYLLAADRRWLYSSFEEKYSGFKQHIDEPGKRLGYLFLDKIFQLSLSVPQISSEVQEAYLNYLYLGKNRYTDKEIETMREEVRKDFSNTRSESELIDKAADQSDDEIENQIRREEAVRASASKNIEVSTEYFLKDFAHLLEPNPRSIKRLVNNYGIYRAMVILSDLELISDLEKRKKFVLWNILNMRWPLLVEYLEDNPAEFEAVLKGKEEQIVSEQIRRLIREPEVSKVLHDNQMGVKLDTEYVARVMNLDANTLY